MINRSGIYQMLFGLIFLLGVHALVVPPTLTAAQESNACMLIEADSVGQPASQDGALRPVKLACDFDNSGTNSDTILVLQRQLPAEERSHWQGMVTGENEIWFYDYRDDGIGEIIISFERQGDALVAYIYEGPFDLGALDANHPKQMIVRLSPSVTVTAPDGWWLDGTRLNLNLDIEVDGAIVAVFFPVDEIAERGITHDGQPDYEIHIRDIDGDGLPDYDWRTVLFPFDDLILPDMALTALMVNAEDNERPIRGSLPWPLLAGVTYGYNTSSPNRTGQPPIQVDWETGRISYIGEFVSSRGNENQWFVYSHYPLVKGEVNVPNFEAPFSYYDLAADNDRLPELAVRYLYYAPYDPYFRKGLLARPVSIVRYSWDQTNDSFWDYKLGLAANHAVETSITLPQDNLSLQMLPYDDIPGWVVDQPWNIITFVAADNARLRGEGLYEWDIPPEMLTTYFSGMTNSALPLTLDGTLDLQRLRYYETDENDPMSIETGLRGEYVFASKNPVRLYISGVDRKLHLFGAEGSIWNVDGSREIRAEDRSGDGYLDTWIQREASEEHEQLVNTGHYLILIAEDQIQVRTTAVNPSLMDTSPPADYEAWQRLGEQLEQAQSGIATDSIPDLFGQYSGATWQIEHVTVYDARFTTQGVFRFVLDLNEESVSSLSTPHLKTQSMDLRTYGDIECCYRTSDLSAIVPPLRTETSSRNFANDLMFATPGRYIVEFLDTAISVVPYTPAALQLTDPQIGNADTPIVELDPVPISVKLTNSGLADARDTVMNFFASKEQRHYQIATITLEALSGSSTQVETLWTPPESGWWTLYISARYQNTSTDIRTQAQVDQVHPNNWTALSLSGAIPANGLLIIGLAGSLMVFAVGLTFRILRSIRVKSTVSVDHEPEHRVQLQWGLILPLLLYVGISYLYLIVRFDGLFIETDTSNQTRVIHGASEASSILESDWPYSNGILYTAISVFLLDITGIPVQALQTVVYPMISAGIALIAVATYRIYVRSYTLAVLAALLLFLQPDFLFVTWRGTHARFTWALLLLLLFVIGRIFIQRNDMKNLSRYVLLFYIFAFAFISSNTFFASSYIVGLLVAFGGGYLLMLLRHYQHQRADFAQQRIQQLFYLASSALILLYIFIFFIYQPALEGLNAIKHLLDRLAIVLLGAEEAFNPYETFVGTNWVGGGLYLLLTSFTWAMLLSAMVVWLLQLRNFLMQKSLSIGQGPRLFLWLAFGAFCAQMIAAIIADRTNALTGNMQVRVFTVVVLIAIPMAVWGLENTLHRGLNALHGHRRLQFLTGVLVTVLVSGASLTAVWKASIEPLVGNKFLFTSIAENDAGDWLIDHIASGSLVWTGMDERVMVSMYFQHVDSLDYDSGPFRLMPEPEEKTQYFMFSDVERLRWERMERPRVYMNNHNQVYDNGNVQIYHRRPQTIFQR